MDNNSIQSSKVTFRCQLLDMVMESATEGMVIVRDDKKVLYANPAVERITGYTYDELVDEGEGFLRHELDQVACKEICDIAHNSDHFRREITVHKKQGDEIHILLSLDTLRNENGEIEYFLGLLTDMTEIKKSREQVEFHATHDALTNLPNRIVMEERLEQAISRASRVNKLGALLFLDLDFFKEINDSLGHILGDALLRDVAQRLQDTCRKQDVVSRFGGDEFIIILEDIQRANDVHAKVKELLTSLNRPFRIHDHELSISASIGVALFPDDGTNVKELVQKADKSMYEAKKSGRNQYYLFDN
jgi:diguanylate cyclase (GGDEF)-like protein/PAS domain S-box-containing protein